MLLNEPVAANRVIAARLYTNFGVPLPLNHTFATGDLKIIQPNGAISNASALPTPVTGASDGTFNIQVAQAELQQEGSIRWQLISSTTSYWEWVEEVTPGISAAAIIATALNPIIKDDVTAFAPELAVVPGAAAWVDILSYTNELDLTALGDSAQTTRMARIFLAAHIAALAARGLSGAAGPVTSESAGGLRRSYGMLTAWASHGALVLTPYGMQYLAILQSSLAATPVLL